MTLEQLCFHFIFTGWLLGTTYQRLVLTNKETNIIALTALRILAVGSVFCFFTPIYLWMHYPNFIQPQIIDGIYWVIWTYIFLIGSGAGVQTVFGLFWGTKQAQKIYSQENLDFQITKHFANSKIEREKT